MAWTRGRSRKSNPKANSVDLWGVCRRIAAVGSKGRCVLGMLVTIMVALCAPIVEAAGPRFASPEGLAFDSSDNLWVANYGSSTVIEIGSNGFGVGVLNTITAAQGLDGPTRLAFDQGGNLFVVNTTGNSVIEYSYSATSTPPWTLKAQFPPKGHTSGALNRPLGIAIDTVNGDIYVVNNGSNQLSVFNVGTSGITLEDAATLASCSAPGAAAFDSSAQTLYVGCGPTNSPNSVNAYYGEHTPEKNKKLQLTAIKLQDTANTGPTGIAFATNVLGNDFLVSYYYSATAVDYINIVSYARYNAIVLSGAPASDKGGCEGIATYNGNVFVSNSMKNTITVFKSAGGLPQAVKWWTTLR